MNAGEHQGHSLGLRDFTPPRSLQRRHRVYWRKRLDNEIHGVANGAYDKGG